MLGTVIGILFTLIILGVVWWAIQQLVGLIPIAEPFKTIKTIIYVVSVVLMVCVVLWVIAALLGIAGIHVATVRLGLTAWPLLS